MSNSIYNGWAHGRTFGSTSSRDRRSLQRIPMQGNADEASFNYIWRRAGLVAALFHGGAGIRHKKPGGVLRNADRPKSGEHVDTRRGDAQTP